MHIKNIQCKRLGVYGHCNLLAALHACVSVMHTHWSYDPHICDLSPVSPNMAAVGASSPYPHTSIFTSLLLTNPLETEWLGDKTDRARDGRGGSWGEGSKEESPLLANKCLSGKAGREIIHHEHCQFRPYFSFVVGYSKCSAEWDTKQESSSQCGVWKDF